MAKKWQKKKNPQKNPKPSSDETALSWWWGRTHSTLSHGTPIYTAAPQLSKLSGTHTHTPQIDTYQPVYAHVHAHMYTKTQAHTGTQTGEIGSPLWTGRSITLSVFRYTHIYKYISNPTHVYRYFNIKRQSPNNLSGKPGSQCVPSRAGFWPSIFSTEPCPLLATKTVAKRLGARSMPCVPTCWLVWV